VLRSEAEAAAGSSNRPPRPAQRPRLHVSDLPDLSDAAAAKLVQDGNADADADAVDVTSAAANAVVDIDLICTIAQLMHPGTDLLNLCVSVGRADARRIRTEYLRDNDEYVTASLVKLAFVPGIASLSVFRDNLHRFDKCRDCISPWMEVNPDWRDRCTDENIRRCKFPPLPLGVNLVFNNPAVAIEIGLKDAFRFLVEEKKIDVNKAIWGSYTTDLFEKQILLRLALVRGDADILTCLLSADDLDFSEMSASAGLPMEHHAVTFAASNGWVTDECFKALLRHPNVNINALDGRGATPLCTVLRALKKWIRTPRAHSERREKIRQRMPKIMLLVEARANLLALDPLSGLTLIEYARTELRNDPGNMHWSDIVAKMEEIIE